MWHLDWIREAKRVRWSKWGGRCMDCDSLSRPHCSPSPGIRPWLYKTESRALLKFPKSGSLEKTYRFHIHFFSLLEVGRGAWDLHKVLEIREATRLRLSNVAKEKERTIKAKNLHRLTSKHPGPLERCRRQASSPKRKQQQHCALSC